MVSQFVEEEGSKPRDNSGDLGNRGGPGDGLRESDLGIVCEFIRSQVIVQSSITSGIHL